jgi:hypothetical protein
MAQTKAERKIAEEERKEKLYFFSLWLTAYQFSADPVHVMAKSWANSNETMDCTIIYFNRKKLVQV